MIKLFLRKKKSNSGDQLWDIPFPQYDHNILYPAPTHHSLNIILGVYKKAYDLATYLHAACFTPSKSTFIITIQIIF